MDGTSGAASTNKPPRLPKSAPRVRLTIVAGPGTGQVVELTRCVTIIGLRSGCKLQLRSPEVSSVHCAIVNTAEEVYLRDLVSTNGTYLNDLKAQFEKLEDGDTVRITDWELRVQISAYELDTLSDLPHVSLEPEPAAFGVEVNGTGKLSRLRKPVGLVGRREGCDIVLRDRQVSRVHVLLFTYAGQPVFCDLLSHNGVGFEGDRARFGVLHSGDELQVGPQQIRMILPGVARRRPRDDSSSSSSALDASKGSSDDDTTAMDGSAEGTVIQLGEDESDRIDIRAAEIDGH